jgi:hypothetical protein
MQLTVNQRTPLPHLALPLAASYGVMNRVQEARNAVQIARNKSVLHFMRAWVL